MDTGRYQSVAPGDHITSQCIRLMTTPALSVSLNMRSREEGSGGLAFSFSFCRELNKKMWELIIIMSAAERRVEEPDEAP